MDKDNIYNELMKMLVGNKGKYNILEEQIDLDLQLEFFGLVNKLMKEDDELKNSVCEESKLYDKELSLDDKKRLLAELSNSSNPESYGIIKRFIDSDNKELYKWAVLALQHSRISLENELLDEQQVFISTGLGGKGEKLRYFIVCKFKEAQFVSTAQQKLVQAEYDSVFKNFSSEVEKITFFGNYFTIMALIPIEVSINQVVDNAIAEANNYGYFIKEKFLVTNVKILNNDEIELYFKKKKI